MTFVFPILLGGLVLAGIPILLHLILRQKPKTLQFPAFRFLVQRHRSNLRKLQLRHLLLLALRMLLIAALCLALARPRLFHESFNLNSERPVAAILIFDTSPTMDYRTTDQLSRLDEAKTRGKEFVKDLPDGSRVLVLDTADAVASDRGDWLVNKSVVAQRIDSLKIRPANGSAARAVEQALRAFQAAAQASDDEALRVLPRLLCVFSDRTVASWPAGKQSALADLTAPLPATLEGVQQVRAAAAPLIDLLKELRTKLPPPAGKDYPEQALVELIEALRDRAAGLQRDTLQTDEALRGLIVQSRRQVRALRDTLIELGEQSDPAIEEYRTKTLASLHGLLRHVSGVQALWVDVGVEQPVDVALLQIELPRQADGRVQQLFGATEKFIVRVVAQALGKDVSTAVICRVDGKETSNKQVDFKAGERQTIPFEIDVAKLNLKMGAHTLSVKLANKDALESNNQLFAAFQIRQPKRILVLADAKGKADRFAFALECVGYLSEIKSVAELPGIDWGKYEAAYLFGLAAPSPEVWQAADAYVKKGGGLGVIPGGDEMKPEAYHQLAAKELIPGTWKTVVKVNFNDLEKPGVPWDLDSDRLGQHALLKPFRGWRDNLNIDFIAKPRWAYAYWKFEPDKKASVLMTYLDKDHSPALIERPSDSAGKTIIFTTTFDDREPRWNNYLEAENSFYLTLAFLSARYLTGEDQGVDLNFQAGVDEPRVPLPSAPRFETYTLRGIDLDLFETLNVDPQVNELRLKEASLPGNYMVEGQTAPGKPGTPLSQFSVNLPPEEGDLARVPAGAIETVFGDGAVVATERGVDLRELLKGQWNEPLELFPYLMVLLLFVLALENLLANKFYRRQE